MGALLEKQEAPASGVKPGIDEVDEADPAWATIAAYLEENSKGFETHYRSQVKLKKLWRVRRCEKFEQAESAAAALGEPTQLCHGTTESNAQAISKEGFRLPQHPGMYGRGIYFAQCPLKSASYARDNSVLSFVGRWIKKGFLEAFNPDKGSILLCDVYLGSSRTVRTSWGNIKPEQDLKAGWFGELLGLGDYHSVTAPGGLFCAVNVAEFIVYQEHQAIPRYLMEVSRERC